VLMVTSEWPAAGILTAGFIKQQADYLRRAGVVLDVFTFQGRRNPWNYAAAWAQLRSFLDPKRHDLVHAQFGHSGLLALPKRLPLVVTFRGSDLLGIVRDRNGQYSWMGRLLQRASRFVARKADAVILVADHLRRQLDTTAPTHVIPSGLDLDLLRRTPRDEARRQLGFAPDERLVLFVGRPHQARKRYELARQAVELLNERLPARLVVGWGMAHTQIPLFMSACDVLIVTSMQEGSPNVVKEALACDLPVVSVPVGDVVERLQGIAGCEICSAEPDALAAGLQRVLCRGGRIAGRRAVEQLDERLLTERVIDVYRSVL
jgi:glycosyltransferase involved in cell wall biosynthesis